MKKNNWLQHIFIFILFFLFSIYITFPLIFHIGSLTTGIGDELVMAWIHNWVIHAITTNPLSLFEANLYYPNHHTLAFAESLIFSSILALPIQKILGEPIVAVNFTLISSLILLGFSIYLLVYYLTKNYLAAILSGVLVIFSPAVLAYAAHLQILAVEWIPLSILCFLHFIKTTKTKFFILSLLFFLFQIYNSFMPAYFILISFFIILIYYWFYERKKMLKLFSKKNIFIVFLIVFLVIPVIYPYYLVSKEFHYVRDIRDAIHFAIQPEDLLYPSDHSRLSNFFLSLPFNKYSQNNEFKNAYIGLVFSLLSIITLFYFVKTFRKKNFYNNSFVTIALVGLLLSLGPVLHLGRQTIHRPFPIPLPYTLFYYILPGFKGFRNSANWEMLFIIGMAISIGFVLPILLKKYSTKIKFVIYMLLIIFSIAEFNFPMQFQSVPQRKDFPKVNYWLAATSPDSVIIQMPIYNWGSWPFTQNELWREYYSTVHFRKMVNGYTSFSPPPWQQFIATMDQEFPDKKSIGIIKNLGVDYIIVDTDFYDKGYKVKQQKHSGKFVVDLLKKEPSLKLVKQFGATYVFTFVD